MSARTQYEHLLFPAGSLPGEIRDYEPAATAPIPTKVAYSGVHGGHEMYRQELDDEGRLLTVTLDGRGMGPYLMRTWTGEDTYTDLLANGRGHSVVESDEPGQRIATTIQGMKTSLISRAEEDGIVTLIARDHPTNPRRPLVFVANTTSEGKILTEEEWAYYDYYGDPRRGPLRTFSWDYDNGGNLASITQRTGKAGATFVEKYERDGDTLKVIGKYPNGVVNHKQERRYDSDGRVEVIRDRVFVPTSALQEITLELSYD